MGINESMDALVKKRQDECDHNEQDILQYPDGHYCKCGMEIR